MLFSSSSSSSSSEDEEIFVRRRKLYRQRRPCFDMYDDLEFFDRFRLTKNTVENLLQQIEGMIALPTNRGGCIKPMNQLLLTLRFYATGNMLIAVGDFMGVSKSSACRIVNRVSYAIASLRPRYIKMYENIAEMENMVEKFYRIARFPKCIGAIDCTLIKTDSVGGDDAEIFRCRKGYFALNVQTVSDADLRIRDIVLQHDQTIFNNSALKQDLENNRYGQYLLIGDSGYTVKAYLMTKLQTVETLAENLYNESIIRTRNVVERQYGVWKRRFMILRLGMRLKLDTIRAVIVATAVLHNLAIDMGEEIPNDWLDDLADENIAEPENRNVENNDGRQIKNLLIHEHFSRLN
ncbi:hypothetical protein NQ315_011268 [Exocentrus adspersus]|uniref:DDE Tnp4 domain-containing protein n=1 Tax=Exocentrus adspersus TaxID=1586481 RepID=A0AAV8VA29_9CUCU|nr:hypothetical protein NQ315_011268 [Exocentrus adspersus]